MKLLRSASRAVKAGLLGLLLVVCLGSEYLRHGVLPWPFINQAQAEVFAAFQAVDVQWLILVCISVYFGGFIWLLRSLSLVHHSWRDASVIGQTALHMIPPRLAVSEGTLAIARRHLIQGKEKADFDFLATGLLWRGERLITLLTHVELANYNRELVNWKLDDKLYREFVLSPAISTEADKELNWRRPLWENFYPRIRREKTIESAAEIVVRHLRERVTITDGESFPGGIESIWLSQITNERGFETIYIAALRSAGIPARLDARGKREFWSETGWKVASRPLIESLVR